MYMEGRKQAQSDCLSQWHLYTVFVACTPLDTTGQILSASLLQLHCFTWHCTDATESTWPNRLHFFLNFLFFTHAPMLGSTLFHRNSKGNYIKLQKPFFRSTLYLDKEAQRACHLPWGGKPCICQPWDLMWDFCYSPLIQAFMHLNS